MSILAAVLLAALPTPAGAPDSIRHARIEVRSGTTPAAALAELARGKGEAWIGWSVPAIPKPVLMCCLNDRYTSSGCSLGEGSISWGTSDDDLHAGASHFYVLVQTKEGAPRRARILSPTCPVDGADRRLIWLGAVDSGASLAALELLLDADRDDALAAVAFHADPRADAILERRALDRTASREERQQAMFWAANARGPSGYRLVERILSSDPSGDIREQAVFALSQLEDGTDWLLDLVRSDRGVETKRRALFWLGQSDDPRALQEIEKILDR